MKLLVNSIKRGNLLGNAVDWPDYHASGVAAFHMGPCYGTLGHTLCQTFSQVMTHTASKVLRVSVALGHSLTMV